MQTNTEITAREKWLLKTASILYFKASWGGDNQISLRNWYRELCNEKIAKTPYCLNSTILRVMWDGVVKGYVSIY